MDMPARCPVCQSDLDETTSGGCIACLLSAGEGPEPDFLIQERLRYFGDYELKEVLGRGGMGMVFRALQVSAGREVALKMISSGELASAEAVRRFRREAEAASLLDHPNIVKIYAVGEHEGHQYIAMEVSGSENLAAKIPALAGDPRLACRIVAQVGRAVHFAHQHGILHRDLKPANILIDADNNPHLTDFGLAKISAEGRIIEKTLTRSNRLMGTPAYMAPEQFLESAKHLTIASEVYSLGVILYEALSGSLPYPGKKAIELLKNVQEGTIIPLRHAAPALPRALSNICAKALRKERHARYQSAEDLAEDLERWLAGEQVLARAESVPELVAHWSRRNRVALAIFTVLISAFLISTTLLIRLRQKSARVQQLIGAARYQLRTDLEQLWSDQSLKCQKITSENLSILAGLEDSGIQNAVHYSVCAYENNGRLTNTVEQYAPILNYLERAMEKPGQRSPRFDLVLYKFNPDARKDFAEQDLHLGRFGANPYNLLKKSSPDVVLVASESMERSGVIVVRKDSGIRSLNQLRGASVAFGEESSTTSGTFAPVFLYENGLRATNFKSFKWHRVNGNALRGVSSGEFDAGVTGRDSFLASGLPNLTVLTNFASQKSVWVTRKSLGQPFIEAFRKALLSCPPGAARKLVRVEGRPFNPSDESQDDAQQVVQAKREAFFAGSNPSRE